MKIAVVTIVNDRFVAGTQVMMRSFLETNRWFKGDFILLHSKKKSKLSQDNQKKLKTSFPNVKLYEVKEEDYSAIDMSLAANSRFAVSYFTLEAFRFSSYDRVLFLDSDLVVLGDLSKLFEKDEFVGTQNSTKIYTENTHVDGRVAPLYVNGGVFSVPKSLLGEATLRELLRIAKPGWKKCDQDVINQWLKTKTYYCVNNRYNCMVKGLRQNDMSLDRIKSDEVKIVHYAGKFKPWNYDSNSPFYRWEKLWTDFYEKHFPEELK